MKWTYVRLVVRLKIFGDAVDFNAVLAADVPSPFVAQERM